MGEQRSPAAVEGRLNDVYNRILDDCPANLKLLDDYVRIEPEQAAAITAFYNDVIAARERAADDGGADSSLGKVGPYQLEREIGRGGQGVVYLATDSRLHRPVALKVLSNQAMFDSAALRRFRREAEITSQLNHPGICPVFEAGTADGSPFIAMRFVAGESLSRRIGAARQGTGAGSQPDTPSPPPRSRARRRHKTSSGPTRWPDMVAALILIEKVARALHVAHEAGVIHRDVKPGNILVATDDEPVIVDFGVARRVEREENPQTVTGFPIGTPCYMSPEQLTSSAHRLDRRSDIYSLGVTLYELFTLRLPFQAVTQEGLFQAISTEQAEDPRRIQPALPRDLATVILTCLEKEPTRRYQTALDLAEDLKRVRERAPILARPVPARHRLWRWYLRHRALGTALVAIFVLLVTALGVTSGLVARLSVAGERSDQMADAWWVDHLRVQEKTLWPRRETTIPLMNVWIENAEQIGQRLAKHERSLALLRRDVPSLDAAGRQREEEFRRAINADLNYDISSHQERLAMLRDLMEEAKRKEAAAKSEVEQAEFGLKVDAENRLERITQTLLSAE